MKKNINKWRSGWFHSRVTQGNDSRLRSCHLFSIHLSLSDSFGLFPMSFLVGKPNRRFTTNKSFFLFLRARKEAELQESFQRIQLYVVQFWPVLHFLKILMLLWWWRKPQSGRHSTKKFGGPLCVVDWAYRKVWCLFTFKFAERRPFATSRGRPYRDREQPSLHQ